MVMLHILLILMSYSLAEQLIDDNLVVELEEGFVKGKFISTWNGRRVRAFLGIPYAIPPVGALRFKDPEDVRSWQGIKNATEDGSSCIQLKGLRGSELQGKEDCLFLNVFVPDDAKPNRPVLFYIHGGFLAFGSANSKDLGPEILLDYGDIILVTVNYRLSVLGFLSIDDEEARGNFGFKDQVAALRWTQRNIKFFGGDPNQVTIFGHSAGATCVGYHLHSDMSKGLFHRAIMSSAAMDSHRATSASFAKENALQLANYLDCPKSYNPSIIMKCLREKPIEDIFGSLKNFKVWNNEPMLVFRPTLENGGSDKAFITEKSVHSTSTVPLIVGYTSEDGYITTEYLKSKPQALAELNERFDKLIPVMLRYDQYEDKDKLTNAIKTFYLKNSDINYENFLDFTYMSGDVLYWRPMLKELIHHDGPAFVYYYTHRGALTYLRDKSLKGVTHGDQQLLIFPYQSQFGEHRISEKDLKTSKESASLITGFVQHGTSYSRWKNFDLKKLNYLHIGTNDLSMKEDMLGARSKFWKDWLSESSYDHVEL